MRHMPDAIIYFTIFLTALCFVICGIYFSTNKTLSIWSLFGGIVFGLLTVFLYWQNDIWKTQVDKVPNTQTQQTASQKTNDTSHISPRPQTKSAKPVKDLGHQTIVPKKTETITSSTNQTSYSQLTNEQLRKEVLILVDKMRGYLERKHLQDETRSLYYQQQMRQAKTEGERQLIWDAQTHDSLTSPSLNFEYSEKWGQIFILDIAGWRKAFTRFLLKQTETKVKDKDLSPISIRIGHGDRNVCGW